MTEIEYKINNFMFSLISKINKPNILEFGVQKGQSFLNFLQKCNISDVHLFSAHTDGCSGISKDSRWTFIKSEILKKSDFSIIKCDVIITKNNSFKNIVRSLWKKIKKN